MACFSCTCLDPSHADITIIHRMKRRGARANVFILDCCRTIKYAPKSRGDSTPTDTQTTEMPNDTVYAYATAAGHKASDGHDGHGKDELEGAQTRMWDEYRMILV